MTNEISQGVAVGQKLSIASSSVGLEKGQSPDVIIKPTIVISDNQNTPKPTAEVKSTTVDDKKLEEVVQKLNDYTQSVDRQLQFSVDDDSGKVMIKVIDSETGETIREIPSEEVINMQKKLKEVSEQLFEKNESPAVSLLFHGKA